jgi:hypothetical protein
MLWGIGHPAEGYHCDFDEICMGGIVNTPTLRTTTTILVALRGFAWG